ncbi:Bacteriophage abortive infection AbiH [Ruminococcus sp. YRD2003]|uniref:AbiH family protein n=1 Tax=Ruminococcus sp. YRD2003 TaxID=1452313 RepID=UPI0008D431B6|nr:Bacteriophage abortive infection AbiH [Ruminococcus flavefaciens]
MVVTFLVGNGFDISCGLNTSYRSFYDWYLQQPSSSDPIRELKKSICNEYENWADFEIGLARYTRNFTIDTVDDFFEIYEDARNNIIKFIQVQTENVDLNAISDKQLLDFKNSLITFYAELPPVERMEIDNSFRGQKIEYSFISFNYTFILNEIVDKVSKIKPASEMINMASSKSSFINPNVINLHGTLKQFPIVGVTEDIYVPNKEILKAPFFRDLMIKPDSVDAVSQIWYEEAKKRIEESNIICIFGMSLGNSDSMWWERIMTHLSSSPKNHLIIFNYDDNPPSGTSIYKTLISNDDLKNRMIDYTALSSQDIPKIKRQIHIIYNTKKVLQLSIPKKMVLPVSEELLKTPISKVKPLF